MARKKLKRFAEIKQFDNVLIMPSRRPAGGLWSSHFKNKNPLVVELGCGAGTYVIELAKKFPKKNFIGVDLKRDRLWRGACKANDEQLKNVAFLNCKIENLLDYFAKDEVSEIWITFPDPFPKPSRAGRRLSSERFMKMYKEVIKKRGKIHLKTDSLPLFNFSKKTFQDCGVKIDREIRDMYSKNTLPPILKFQTHYEKKFLQEGRKIYYLRAIL